MEAEIQVECQRGKYPQKHTDRRLLLLLRSGKWIFTEQLAGIEQQLPTSKQHRKTNSLSPDDRHGYGIYGQ